MRSIASLLGLSAVLLIVSTLEAQVPESLTSVSVWTDAKGKQVSARVISCTGAQVILRTEKGREIIIAVNDLNRQCREKIWAALTEQKKAIVESRRANRKWTDTTGKFSVFAEITDIADGNVVLKKKVGEETEEISVPIAKLSEPDRAYIQTNIGIRLFRNWDGWWRSSAGEVFKIQENSATLNVAYLRDDGSTHSFDLGRNGPIAVGQKDPEQQLSLSPELALTLTFIHNYNLKNTSRQVYVLQKMSPEEVDVFNIKWKIADRRYQVIAKERELASHIDWDIENARKQANFWAGLGFLSSVLKEEDLVKASQKADRLRDHLFEKLKPIPNAKKKIVLLKQDARFPSPITLDEREFWLRVEAACPEHAPKYTTGTCAVVMAVTYVELYLTVANQTATQEEYLAAVRATARRILAHAGMAYAVSMPGFEDFDLFRLDWGDMPGCSESIDTINHEWYETYAQALKALQTLNDEEKVAAKKPLDDETIMVNLTDVVSAVERFRSGCDDYLIYRRAKPVTQIVKMKDEAGVRLVSLNDVLGGTPLNTFSKIKDAAGRSSKLSSRTPSEETSSKKPSSSTITGTIRSKDGKAVAKGTKVKIFHDDTLARGSYTTHTDIHGNYSLMGYVGFQGRLYVNDEQMWEGKVIQDMQINITIK